MIDYFQKRLPDEDGNVHLSQIHQQEYMNSREKTFKILKKGIQRYFKKRTTSRLKEDVKSIMQSSVILEDTNIPSVKQSVIKSFSSRNEENELMTTTQYFRKSQDPGTQIDSVDEN